jgi:hypothetical protein
MTRSELAEFGLCEEEDDSKEATFNNNITLEIKQPKRKRKFRAN